MEIQYTFIYIEARTIIILFHEGRFYNLLLLSFLSQFVGCNESSVLCINAFILQGKRIKSIIFGKYERVLIIYGHINELTW